MTQVLARPRAFTSRLWGIAAISLAVRLLYALVVMANDPVTGDGGQYQLLAQVLADEERYLQPFRFVHLGEVVPTAEKPLLYPLLLALPGELGLRGLNVQHVVDCVLGALTVVLVGLLGRRAAGERAGLVAAAIAALYPMQVILSGSARSEALYAPLIAGVLLLAYRLLDGPSARRGLALGAVIGLATLTRSEALALLVLLVPPALWLIPSGGRLRLGVAVLAGCLVVVGPWVARNWITFDRPALTTNEGGLLLGANCDAAYFSELIGTWPCFPDPPRSWGTNEAEISSRFRSQAIDYAQEHSGRVPAVVAVRVLRTWELWDPIDQAELEHGISDRNLKAQQAGVLCLYLLVALAVYGGVLLRRRGQPLRILLAPIVLVTVVSALTYGSSRFRVAAELPVMVLAAVAVAELASRRRGGAGRPREAAAA